MTGRPDLPWDGGCRCGRLRIRVTAPPLLASVCHCTGCQSMSASAFSTTLTVPADDFEVTTGEPVVGGLHGDVRHNFCPWCLTWVFTGPFEDMGFVNLRATMLDDHRWFVPFVEVWTREKLPWATTPAVHSFESEPEMDAYADLIAEYGRQTASEATVE